MKFRDDIDIWNTWVTSDTHFGHNNIVGFCHRPEDHEQVIIAEWRKAVPDDATVLHLGDLCFRGNAFFKNIVAKELTGARKLLILGNHDHQRMSFYRDCGFKISRPFQIAVNVDDEVLQAATGDALVEAQHIFPWSAGWRTVSFSHYPWNEAEEGSMLSGHTHIHGHIHNSGYTRDAFVPFLKDHINVSIEQTRYAPVNLGLLLDAALRGRFPETTEAQLEDARRRKKENLAQKEEQR